MPSTAGSCYVPLAANFDTCSAIPLHQQPQRRTPRFGCPTLAPRLLSCRLPAVACPPPLLAELLVVPGTDPAKPGSWQGLVVLRYVASPQLPGPLLDVVVDLSVPPEAATLVRTSPSAQWSKEQCQLRWTVPRIAPGAAGELRAVFGGKAGVAAAAATSALSRQAEARLLFSLRPGKSLSGVGFQVAAAEPEAPFMPANMQCFGEMRVRV